MSQENVESLRAHLGQWNGRTLCRETRPWDIDLSLLDPDVIFEDTALPDEAGDAYRGHEGVARAWSSYVEPFEWMAIELEQIIDAGDRLVSIQRVQVKARHTGIEFEYSVTYLWTFRDGKVIHFRGYRDPKQALKAVGLEE